MLHYIDFLELLILYGYEQNINTYFIRLNELISMIACSRCKKICKNFDYDIENEINEKLNYYCTCCGKTICNKCKDYRIDFPCFYCNMFECDDCIYEIYSCNKGHLVCSSCAKYRDYQCCSENLEYHKPCYSREDFQESLEDVNFKVN